MTTFSARHQRSELNIKQCKPVRDRVQMSRLEDRLIDRRTYRQLRIYFSVLAGPLISGFSLTFQLIAAMVLAAVSEITARLIPHQY